MTKRRLHIHDYAVGWVCALPIELAAATEMLDEEHQNLPQDDNDANLYTLGRIGEHNVVITCLPAGQTGTNSAATVASQMTSKFVSIRFGLMVGIGGGVPSADSDIRLGDVVISQPHMQHGGVVQYDFGETKAGGHFTRTGFLNAPPTILLKALSKVQANHLDTKAASPNTYLRLLIVYHILHTRMQDLIFCLSRPTITLKGQPVNSVAKTSQYNGLHVEVKRSFFTTAR